MNKQPEPRASQPGVAPTGKGPGDAAEGSPSGYREPLGTDAVEQLRSYQVMTIPPSVRRALLGAALPGASPDLLFDTIPPNQTPTGKRAAEQSPPSTSRRPGWRSISLALASLLVALLLLAWLRLTEGPPERTSMLPPRSATPATIALKRESTAADRSSLPQLPSPTSQSAEPTSRVLLPSSPKARATARSLETMSGRPSSTRPPLPAPVVTAAASPAPSSAPAKGFRLGSR